MYMHIKAVEALRAQSRRQLPLNVKFLIEGEEEVGGESIAKYVPENTEKLKADVALVSDTELFADGIPTLCIGLRGLMYMEIEATGPARDLHSGMYGGAAPNAVYGLIELLAKAKDADGRIQIPGIYDDVAPPDAAETESWKRLPFSEEEFLQERSRLHSADRRAGAIRARAYLGAPHLRSPWHRRRLHRGRSQDRDPRQGHRQGQHPPGAQSGSRKSHSPR